MTLLHALSPNTARASIRLPRRPTASQINNEAIKIRSPSASDARYVNYEHPTTFSSLVVILFFSFVTLGVTFAQNATEVTMALVKLGQVERPDGKQCLQFAFENLPEHFAIGEVHFSIVATTGLAPISGEMASKINMWYADMQLSPAVLTGEQHKIIFDLASYDIALQSERKGDSAYLYFCPILNRSGLAGNISVVPSFFSPAAK